MGAEEYSAPVHAGMAGSGLLSVDPEQPIFGNILPRAAFYGFKGSLRTGQIPRFRQCDAKAGIDFIGVDRSLLQSQPVKRCRLRIIAIAKIGVTDGSGDLRSEEHTSELQSLMRISYAVFGV